MTLAGERVENTFHYLLGVEPDIPTMTAMANTYIAWWVANAGLYSNACGLVLIYLRSLTTQTSPTVEIVPGATTTGTRVSPLKPNNCSIAIKRQTGHAGRKNRGRVYWVGITNDMMSDSNDLIPLTAANMAGALNTLLSDQAVGNAAQEVILHRSDGTTTPVISYTVVDQAVDSQRRRLPGHNRHH